MAKVTSPVSRHSNAYDLFILALTVISLVIMVMMLLPLNDATIALLQFYDNLICVIFLFDFFMNLKASPKKSDYFIKERGWLDLLGSIPSLGVGFKWSGLLRLARLSRLTRIIRILREKGGKAMFADVARNRSSYTAYITILLTIFVLASATVLVLQFESRSPDANITTGWNAFWWSIVTITTVGYGDYYPVTVLGRITAMFVMFSGVGIIGVLASLLSSLLMSEPSTPAEEETPGATLVPTVEQELATIKTELAAMRRLLEERTAKTGDTP